MKLVPKLSLVITIFTLLATGATAEAVYVATRYGFNPLPLAGIALVVATVSVVTMVLILNNEIMGPIRALSTAVKRISLGDLSQQVSVPSNDELGTLSQSFNEMTRQLGSTHRSLEASTRVAKEERAQLMSSINGLRQGFIYVNTKDVVTLANAAAEGFIHDVEYEGKPTAKTKGGRIRLEDIVRVLPKDFDLKGKIAQCLTSRTLVKFADLGWAGRYFNLYMSPVLNEDTAIGCVLLFEDMTEERILQRSRDEFFSIASHELRTPLTAIRGNTVMIQQYFPDMLKNPDVRAMMDDIHESTVRLIDIVNDFLDTSRLEQNKMKFDSSVFPLEGVIEKVVYELSRFSRDKHVKLEFDQHTLGKLPLVYADPNRITQVVYNLFGNAMKFTEKGSVIINCWVDGRFVKVCVSDTGRGISPEGQQLLFHKFQQSNDSILTRDNTRGTGLGLYISKLLVEHMGGSIKLEHSEVGKGSVFSFTVPVASKEQIKASNTALTAKVPAD
jgi:signal transduction histidine kinase/HAMP domain-containing protein